VREVTVTVYKYDELDDKAKKKAIEWMRKSENESFGTFHTDDITEMFSGMLEDSGFTVREEDIAWSLSHSQGDGVSFSGDVDLGIVLPLVLNADELKNLDRVRQETEASGDRLSFSVVRSRNSRYCHSGTMDVEADGGTGNEDDEKFIDMVCDKILKMARDLARELEEAGYDEIDYLLCDETLIQQIKGNDYEFFASGDISDL